MRKTYLILLFLFLTGAFLRVFPVRKGVRDWDETVYLQDGKVLAGQNSSDYTELDFRPPMIPMLVGAVFFLGGGVLTAQLVISIISSLAIVGTFLLVSEVFSDAEGVIAAIIVLLSSEHVHLSHYIMVDSVLPVLWSFTAYFLYRGINEGKKSFLGISGFLTGLSILTKFTSLVLIPLSVVLYLYISDRYSWDDFLCFVTALSLPLLPYFAWNYASFGNPLHVFLQGFKLSGATDNFLTYFKGFGKLIPISLIFLSVITVYDKDRMDKHTFLLGFFFTLFLPLQFIVGNKELRFLLPVLPFASGIVARSLKMLSGGKKVIYALLLVMVVVVSGNSLITNSDHVKTLRNGVYETRGTSSIHEASKWIGNNTEKTSLVYTNFEWPLIAYYSGRNLDLLPVVRRFEENYIKYMSGKGYVVYQSYSPYEDFSLKFLKENEDFVLNKTFSGEVYIFYYGGREW